MQAGGEVDREAGVWSISYIYYINILHYNMLSYSIHLRGGVPLCEGGGVPAGRGVGLL